RVFAAWADRDAKAKWFVGPDGQQSPDYALDFRIGGRESVSGGPVGGPVFRYDARYYDIVPNERIVYAYEMYMDADRISVSVATVELTPAGDRTQIIVTKQGAFLDRLDQPNSREKGVTHQLDTLGEQFRG